VQRPIITTMIALGETDPSRTVWTVSGQDALTFLQGLVTNDLRPLEAGPGIVWAALLTPRTWHF
jgi:tRNA-modifying protein YgfZ